MPDFKKMLDETRVFKFWQERQKAPDRCKLTDPRKASIKSALKDYSCDDLCKLIRYAYESNTGEARYWRGENETGREYLDISNLFVAKKLAGRIENALQWVDEQDHPEGSAQPYDPVRAVDALCRRGPNFAPPEEPAKKPDPDPPAVQPARSPGQPLRACKMKTTVRF